MRDIAATVMEHLELAKDSDDRDKGEKMVRGLTDFIERSSLPEAHGEPSGRLTTLEKQTENARRHSVADMGRKASASTAENAPCKRDESKSETYQIFQRAAKIIRQSTHADGVVFFDTSAACVGGHVHQDKAPVESSDGSQTSSTDFLATDSTRSSTRKKVRGNQIGFSEGSDSAGNKSLDSISEAGAAAENKACPVAGFSLRSGDSLLIEDDFSFTRAGMERYIHRYPSGKFFNFDQDGVGITSGEEKSEKSGNETHERAYGARNARKRRVKFIPTELLDILPSVRSLIFLPLWDPASERWIAGGFIWTNRAGRLLSPLHELPYLKAFGNCITSEIARANAQKLNRAKTTFIASISHELRSPLHGILGSVELLYDSIKSDYQSSLVSSIETCGRTLLDTIDHVLDYAKINRLQNATSRGKNRSKRLLPGENSILGVMSNFNLAQLVEEVCDAVCAGHAFSRMHSLQESTVYDQLGSRDSRSSNTQQRGGSEEIERTASSAGDQKRVSVVLNIAPFVNWIVRSQPGALRRIVMNLLGNSLKYTDTGHVAVTLLQEKSVSHSVMFRLIVKDTGKGMSTDYQRSKLFAPFSQEDPFAAGTGLGLSIVKQIVDSLEGEVDVESTLGAGTKITVALRLPGATSENARIVQRPLQAPEALQHKSAIVMFPPEGLGGSGRVMTQSIQHACHGFGMSTHEHVDMAADQVDFLITEATSLERILAEYENCAAGNIHAVPLTAICICADPVEKTAVWSCMGARTSALGWAVEVVAQP